MTDDEIVKLYQEGYFLRQIARLDGVQSIEHATTVLRDRPDSGYYPGRRRSRRRAYFYDEHFFDEINTQEKAYFLGLFVSDGWLKRQSSGVYSAACYELLATDREVLDYLSNLFGDQAPKVKTRRPKDFDKDKARLVFHSTAMCRALTSMGLTNNKSLDGVQISQFVPPELHRHYVRGYFDGNGSATIEKYRLRIGFRGNLVVMQDLREIIPVYMILVTTQFPSLQTSKHSEAAELFHWMYEDANVFLSRKYDKCVSGLAR